MYSDKLSSTRVPLPLGCLSRLGINKQSHFSLLKLFSPPLLHKWESTLETVLFPFLLHLRMCLGEDSMPGWGAPGPLHSCILFRPDGER